MVGIRSVTWLHVEAVVGPDPTERGVLWGGKGELPNQVACEARNAQMANPRVAAVLFDSGGVLIGPVGGRWNPRFDFEEIVRREAPGLTEEEFSRAAVAGDTFLATADATPTRDDYHRVVLRVLGVEPSLSLLADLDKPVDPAAVVEPFPEVIEVLDTLRSRRMRMAVVSDAWPQLADLHAGVGLSGYFEVYAISAVLGCTKPDPRMYRHASYALGLAPGQCLFVDDDPRLVEAAIALGYQGCAVLRDGSECADVPSITDLRELLAIID